MVRTNKIIKFCKPCNMHHEMPHPHFSPDENLEAIRRDQ